MLASPSKRLKRPSGWSQQDLADLYRVGDQLTQLGFPVAVHTGQSDEGDPWAVFEQDRTGEVVVHVARINGELVIADVVRERVHRGRNFRSLADRLLNDAPLALPQGGPGDNVVLHPRVVMVAFVAAAIVASEFARPASAEPVEEGAVATPPAAPPAEAHPDRITDGRDVTSGLSAGLAGSQSLAQNVAIAGLAASLAALSVQSVEASQNPSLPGAAADGAAGALVAGAVTIAVEWTGLGEMPPLDAGLLDQDLAQMARVANEGGDVPATPSPVARRSDAPPTAEELPPAPYSGASEPTAELRNTPPSEEVDHNVEMLAPTSVRNEAATAGLPSAPDAPSTAVVFEWVAASIKILDSAKLPDIGVDPGSNGAIILHRDGLPPADSHMSLSENDATVTEGQPTAAPAMQERFLLAHELSNHLVLDADTANVVVYMGGEVSVTGFTFGRDRIAFIEDAGAPDWLVSVGIDRDDVVLVGQDGGSVTLFGALATLV